MKPAPRPPARLLLAGRFLVPRAALLALPDGPVPALDLSSGALVALAFGPTAAEAEEVAARCTRWNELALPGCPAVRELCMHLGRPLVICELRPPRRGAGRVRRTRRACRRARRARSIERASRSRLGPADLAPRRRGPVPATAGHLAVRRGAPARLRPRGPGGAPARARAGAGACSGRCAGTLVDGSPGSRPALASGAAGARPRRRPGLGARRLEPRRVGGRERRGTGRAAPARSPRPPCRCAAPRTTPAPRRGSVPLLRRGAAPP